MTFDWQKDFAIRELDSGVFDKLSQFVHQAAQPLTAMLGWLELAQSGEHSEQEYRTLAAHAAEESCRVMACFERVRALARANQYACAHIDVAITATTRAVLDKFHTSFLAAGVKVLFEPGSPADDRVAVPEDQIFFVLSLVISSLFPFLKRGDKLEISKRSDQKTVSICILVGKHSAAYGAPKQELDWELPQMGMARSLLFSSGGRITLGESAFAVQIDLPKALVSVRETETVRSAHV